MCLENKKKQTPYRLHKKNVPATIVFALLLVLIAQMGMKEATSRIVPITKAEIDATRPPTTVAAKPVSSMAALHKKTWRGKAGCRSEPFA